MFLEEPELHLFGKEEPLVPDVAGWRRERMPEIPETAAIAVAPDWVYEVLSRGTAAHDRIKKMPLYAAAKIGHAWLADPETKSLEVCRREDEGWLYVAGFEGEVTVRAEPFGDASIDLTRLWRL